MNVMRRPGHALVGLAFGILCLALFVEPGGAHKPITSPFTYTEDVFPILRDRCARCHIPDGVAPMSLMTYEDTVPWGESIRVELLAGHMPPWSVDAAPTRFRNAPPLSAREMNVLITWATGGTPFGNPEKTPAPVTHERRWALGPPDLELAWPREITLPADKQEDVVEFVLPTGFPERRWLRAVDLAPGTPAIVRSATVQVKPAAAPGADRAPGTERTVALWLPGDDPIAVDGNAAFEVPANAELLVRVRYKKTWQYERKELRDRSALALYFAKGASEPVRAIELMHEGPALEANGARRQISEPIRDDVRVLALYPANAADTARVVLAALAPDGTRRELIAFHPQREWARRYWFKDPIVLERGTKLETTVSVDDEMPSLPLSQRLPSGQQDSPAFHLTLNVISASK
jgi:hypothetical protein